MKAVYVCPLISAALWSAVCVKTQDDAGIYDSKWLTLTHLVFHPTFLRLALFCLPRLLESTEGPGDSYLQLRLYLLFAGLNALWASQPPPLLVRDGLGQQGQFAVVVYNSRRKCRSCVCVKQGRVCTTCLPSRSGGCHNVRPPSCSPVIGPTPVFAPSLSSIPSSTVTPPPHIIASSSLPSWASIFSLRSSTLRHVPKGVRNSWADLLFHVFSAIIHHPSDLDNWLKLFILPRCILANPPNGDRLGWRKLQEIVTSRIRKWERGDISVLWEEVVSSTSSKNASM